MNLEKLKYSKCPNCKKHGIPAFRKIGRYRNLVIECKCCGKKYKVKSFLSPLVVALVVVADIILVALAERFLSIDISFRAAAFPILLIVLLCEFFFAPLEEVDE